MVFRLLFSFTDKNRLQSELINIAQLPAISTNKKAYFTEKPAPMQHFTLKLLEKKLP